MRHRNARPFTAVAFDETALLQEPDPLAHGGSVYPQLFSQLHLCGQRIADTQTGRENLALDGVVDQPVCRRPLYPTELMFLHFAFPDRSFSRFVHPSIDRMLPYLISIVGQSDNPKCTGGRDGNRIAME